MLDLPFVEVVDLTVSGTKRLLVLPLTWRRSKHWCWYDILLMYSVILENSVILISTIKLLLIHGIRSTEGLHGWSYKTMMQKLRFSCFFFLKKKVSLNKRDMPIHLRDGYLQTATKRDPCDGISALSICQRNWRMPTGVQSVERSYRNSHVQQAAGRLPRSKRRKGHSAFGEQSRQRTVHHKPDSDGLRQPACDEEASPACIYAQYQEDERQSLGHLL